MEKDKGSTMQSSINTGQNQDQFEQKSCKKSAKFFEDKIFRPDTLKQEHVTEVVKIFTQSFCDYEPMTRYLEIHYDQFTPFAKQVVEKAVHDQLSIVILNGKKVVAFAIVDDVADTTNISTDVDPKFKFIFGLLQNLSGLFLEGKSFERRHLSHLFITAVDPAYQGLGLSKKVNAEAMKLAVNKGFDFMCCEFTNARNEQGTVKNIHLNKLLLNSCKYSDFIYENGKPFEKLEGCANAYLWELKPGRTLSYRKNEELEIVNNFFDLERKTNIHFKMQ